MLNLLILDSGHNEKVQGKQSPDGTFKEWKFNDEMQYLIKKRAEDHNIKVCLTNPKPAGIDEIGLHKRNDIANAFYKNNSSANALFASIHSNAYLPKDAAGKTLNIFNEARGTEVFIASNASSNSKNAANLMQAEIVKAMRSLDKNAKDRGVKVEDWTVIYGTITPAILIEYAFYTNKEDLNILKNNKAELVEATIRAICKYFNIAYKPINNTPINNAPTKPPAPVAAAKKYKVVIGTYTNKDNAINQAEEAKKKGFETDIIEV